MCQDSLAAADNYKYIIDRYNSYQNNNNVVDFFTLIICGKMVQYCIRKIPVKKYEWGCPILEEWEQQDYEQDYSDQCAYDTYEEAKNFVRALRRANR